MTFVTSLENLRKLVQKSDQIFIEDMIWYLGQTQEVFPLKKTVLLPAHVTLS
jgi:hypothetical protein